jgi:hypothetical protein
MYKQPWFTASRTRQAKVVYPLLSLAYLSKLLRHKYAQVIISAFP